jgi:8-oxo-dGTP diphosphatase
MMRTGPRQVFHAYDPQRDGNADACRFCPRCGATCAPDHVGGRLRQRCGTCGYVHYRNPPGAVAVVVLQDGHVLLGRRRPATTFGGKWAFPAGFIEFDEDFLAAAQRETKEETGLDIVVTGILNVTSNHLQPSLHALVVGVAARPIGGALLAGDGFCAVRWVRLDGPLPALAYEADADLLRVLQAGGAAMLPVHPRPVGSV